MATWPLLFPNGSFCFYMSTHSLPFLLSNQRRIINHIHCTTAQSPPVAPHGPWNRTRTPLHVYACMAGLCLTLFTSPPPSTCFIHGTSATDLEHIRPAAKPGEGLGFVEHSRKTFPWADGHTDREAHCSIISTLKTKKLKTNAHQTAWWNNYILFILWTISSRDFFPNIFFFSTDHSKKYILFTGLDKNDLDNPLLDKVSDPSPGT